MIDLSVIQDEYGTFFAKSPTVDFDPADVPPSLTALIPYASFWGLSDDVPRELLVEQAPAPIQRSLRQLLAKYDDALDVWLAGEEASSPHPGF